MAFGLHLALRAFPGEIMNDNMSAALQNRFEIVMIAVCTKCMRVFAVLMAFFKDVGEGTTIELFQFIAFLICVPCFKAGHFFFKIVYLINRRRIARLGGDNLFPEISNGRIPFIRT